jgi:hypothetical protein
MFSANLTYKQYELNNYRVSHSKSNDISCGSECQYDLTGVNLGIEELLNKYFKAALDLYFRTEKESKRLNDEAKQKEETKKGD